MQEFVLNNLHIYGPLAVFALLMLSGIGIPLSEDVIIIPAGFLISRSELPLLHTAAAAYFGVVIADILWFSIMSHFGSRLLNNRWLRKMIHPRRLLQAKHQMDKRGAWMIVFARFIPGSRSSAITVAGLLHMSFWKFAAATSVCVIFTVTIQLGLGMLIAKGFGSEDSAKHFLQVLGLLMAVIAIFFVVKLVKKYRGHKKGPPRARAAWLRRFRVPRIRRKPKPEATNSSERTTPDQG